MVDETELIQCRAARRPRGVRRAGATDLRRSLHPGGPTHRERGGRTRRGPGRLSPGLEGHRQVPRRRRAQHLAVPDHRQLRVDAPVTPPPAPAPSRCCRASSRPMPATRPSPRRWPRRASTSTEIAARGRRSAAEAARGRGAPGRVRPAPRGDRRGAGDLAVGREGAAAPGPEAAPGRGVRGEEVVSCGMRTSPICSRVWWTARWSDDRTRAFIDSDLRCQAELARYRRLLRGLGALRTTYLEPAPGGLAQTLNALAAEGERRVARSILTGRRRGRGRRRARWRGRGRRRDRRGDRRPLPPPPAGRLTPGAPEPHGRRIPGMRPPAGSRLGSDGPAPARPEGSSSNLAELRSPKPAVGGSSPSCPAPNTQHE